MREIPIPNVYYLLCYAWNLAQHRDTRVAGEAGRLSSVQDLLGKVLATGVKRLLRRGIDRGYVDRREELAGIRGKLAVGATAKRALRARGRVACDYEELSVDITANRILRSTLGSLRRLGEYGSGVGSERGLDRRVRSEVVRAYDRLGRVSVIPLSRRAFGMVQLDRNRSLYRFLLAVCQLVYDSQVVDSERTDRTIFRDFRKDEQQMWQLFEQFVTGFYLREQHEFEVNTGGRGIRWSKREGATDLDRELIPQMQADIVLESDDRRIIMDTKYHATATANRYGSVKLKSGNLYQLLTYLRNRQANNPAGPKHEGILLYPQVDEPLAAEVRLEGFRVQACTIDLGQPWQGIHDDLLEILRRRSRLPDDE